MGYIDKNTDKVDWEAKMEAMKEISIHHRYQLIKYIKGMSGVKKRKFWKEARDECLECGKYEIITHVMPYRNEEAV